jgi:hypothetical protein
MFSHAFDASLALVNNRVKHWPMHNTLKINMRRLSIVLLVLIPAALAWFALSPQPEVVLARNLMLYRAEPFWRALELGTAGSGTLRGTVRSVQGAPLAETTVVAAAADGRAFAALSDAAGRYELALPSGSYVPVATHAGFDDAPLQWGPLRLTLNIADGSDARADFSLSPSVPHPFVTDGALAFFDDTLSHSDIPQPAGGTPSPSAAANAAPPGARAEGIVSPTAVPTAGSREPADVRRRAFAFLRAGVTLTGSQVYEPYAPGHYPVLLFIYPCWTYPCSVMGWDLLSASMAARGYVVVAYAPQRGLDLEADMDDLLTLLAHIRANHLSARGDGSRVALLTGSLTSIHLWRVIQLAPAGVVGGVVVLGGLSDLFLIRERFEAGTLALEPPFAEPLSTALIALGRPNLNPDFYVRYSPVYHLDALSKTPIALIYGGQDKIVPPEQTAHFSGQLLARGIAHEIHLYPELEHYLDLSTLNPGELDMFEQVVGFLQRTLGK